MNTLITLLVKYFYSYYRKKLIGTRFGNYLSNLSRSKGYFQEHLVKIAKDSQKNNFIVQTETNTLSDISVPGFYLTPLIKFNINQNFSKEPHINILLPSVRKCHMSGGPNTALIIAAMLAERGWNIRLIATDAPAKGEENLLYGHIDNLIKRKVKRSSISIIDGFDRSKKIDIDINDFFFATAWWTAVIAQDVMDKMAYKKFIYLIQDYEPILHNGSSFHALANETYSFPHIPIINTKLLFSYLVENKIGLFADQSFQKDAVVFEPAIDQKFFFAEKKSKSKHNLLFYARPNAASRNLFEIGAAALQLLAKNGLVDSNAWNFWAVGEDIADLDLGNDMVLKTIPWLDFADYAKQVRQSDIFLSLMYSPHPSYPPLEMAASGNFAVTNSFSRKLMVS